MSNPTSAQLLVQEQVQDWVGNITHAPGVCVAVYDESSFKTDGYVFPFGQLGVDDSTLVTTDTVFELASVTKVFTSTLLALFVQTGNAWLTDTLGTWLNYDHTFDPSQIGSAILDSITLQQLATHTSGMPGQPGPGFANYNQQLFADQLPTIVIPWWNKYATSPPNPPCWQYSNAGFVTLGYALTQMYPVDQGHNYNEILQKFIASLLGMTHTTSIVESSWQVATGCNAHFTKSGVINVPTNEVDFGISSTGDDMLMFLKAQLHPPPVGPGTQPPIGPAILLTQQEQNDYPICDSQNKSVTMGLGWQITYDTQKRAIFAKDGGTSRGGFQSFVTFVPGLDCGVAVLSNQCVGQDYPKGALAGALAENIIQALHPDFALAEPLPAPDLSV